MLIGYFMDQVAHAAWLKHAKMMYKLPEDPVVIAKAESLPPPLFEGNLGRYTTQCILEKQLPQFVGSKEVRPGSRDSQPSYYNKHECRNILLCSSNGEGIL